MSSHPPSSPDADDPVDAIVYDVHPALAPRPPAGTSPCAAQPGYPYGAYPYGSVTDEFPASTNDREFASTFAGLLAEMFRPINVDLSRKADYAVPQRFGMSALLGIMTALAVLFGFLRLLNAAPSAYLFFGLQAVVICMAQMLHEHSPRRASIIAGAILLPLFSLYSMVIMGADELAAYVCSFTFSVPAGAFLGYLTGTCAAGVFLLMDALERYIKGQRPVFQTAGPPLHGAGPGTGR